MFSIRKHFSAVAIVKFISPSVRQEIIFDLFFFFTPLETPLILRSISTEIVSFLILVPVSVSVF